ncbi:MAG TPA: hypothetical protein VFE62_08985 [Gemmataceae bacterium]|nr:hypothetical protein [Gemmataceae bacterium]
MATKIVMLAQTAGISVFHTPDYVPFVRVPIGNHRENYPIQSTVFRRWLSGLYFRSLKRAPNANAIADAVSILAANAIHNGQRIEAHTRVARLGGTIYLDLADADWRVIEITRDGWRIVSNPTVMFRRPPGMYQLPEPKVGGSIDLLRQFVNTKSESGFRLVIAFLVACLRPGRPFPVLFLRGEQGSAKSTLARLLRNLTDPNKAPLRRPPRDDRDLILAAMNGWNVVFDNLSFIPYWLSDGLCCLATGAGFGTRTTNDEETLFQATRPIIVTAIEDVVTRGDLMDRCLIVELTPIPDERRRTEADIEADFAKMQPLILGALLDAVSVAIRNYAATRLPALPRMADFAQWVSAAELALGWKAGSFMADYSGNRDASIEAILDDSPIYGPLMTLLDEHSGHWEGTPTDLLDALTTKAGDKNSKHKSWPAKPNALTNRLKRLSPALRARGITIERERTGHDGRRTLRVCRTPSESSARSASGDSYGRNADDSADDCRKSIGSEIPRKSYCADNADDADDGPQTPRDSNFAGPYLDRI